MLAKSCSCYVVPLPGIAPAWFSLHPDQKGLVTFVCNDVFQNIYQKRGEALKEEKATVSLAVLSPVWVPDLYPCDILIM